jgi:hypothetical protein
MAIPEKFHLDPFWDKEYRTLSYRNEKFNNHLDISRWTIMGFSPKFTGDMCDMRQIQPSWNKKIIQHFEDLGWQNVCTSYYRMSSGTILPEHIDTYARYTQIFNLQGRENLIIRALLFLEDWASGHYFELDHSVIVEWKAGDYYIWSHCSPHLAANLGAQPRYTLQLTGHL